jgi:hypothetical protein
MIIRKLEEIYKDELLLVMSTFQKDKSPSLDGWTIEFYLTFFDLLGDNLKYCNFVVNLDHSL